MNDLQTQRPRPPGLQYTNPQPIHSSAPARMKKLTIIGCIVGLVITGSLLFWSHKSNPSSAPIVEAHTYMIAPDVFFAGLRHLVAPKTGESPQQLLVRYFQQQNVQLEGTNDVEVFAQAGTGTGHLQVRFAAADREKVERLIAQIPEAK